MSGRQPTPADADAEAAAESGEVRITLGRSLADHGGARIFADWRPFIGTSRQPALGDLFVAPDVADADGVPWQLQQLRQVGAWHLEHVIGDPYDLAGAAPSRVAVSDDGRLVLAWDERAVRLFDACSGREIRSLSARATGPHQALRVLASTDLAVVGNRLLDLTNGRRERGLPHLDPIDAAMQAGGRIITLAPGRYVRLDPNGAETTVHLRQTRRHDHGTQVALSPCGTRLARVLDGETRVRVHDLDEGTVVLRSAPLGDTISAVAVGAGGHPLLVGADRHLLAVTGEGEDDVRELLGDDGGRGQTITRLALDPTGRLVAVARANGEVQLVNVRTGRVEGAWPAAERADNETARVRVVDLAVTADGWVLAAEEPTAALRIHCSSGAWDHTSSAVRAAGPVRAVALASAAPVGVAVHANGTIRVVDVETGTEMRTIRGPVPLRHAHAAVSADGRIAWTDGPGRRVHARALASGDRIRTLELPGLADTTSITALVASDDGLEVQVAVRDIHDGPDAPATWYTLRVDGRDAPPPGEPPAEPDSLLGTLAVGGIGAADRLTVAAFDDDERTALAGTERGALLVYHRGGADGLRVARERQQWPGAGDAAEKAENESEPDAKKKTRTRRKKMRGR